MQVFSGLLLVWLVMTASPCAAQVVTDGNVVADGDVEIGKSYFYRVRAINETGVSPYSNIVGPVDVAWNALVDECSNFEYLSQHSGNIQIHSKQARKTQEDVHRFELMPGSSLTYKVRRGAALSPSILLFHKPHQTAGVQPVRRAAELKSQCVHVVATMLCEIDENRQVVGYGMLSGRKLSPLNQELLAGFQETLRETFAEAVAHDLDVAVVAHLNSWGKVSDWRNFFKFDPLAKYGQYNYQQAVIEPIVAALVEAHVPLDRVKLSLAGEMGHSVFSHPESYRKLMQNLRGSIQAAAIQLGVSFNFNRVSGEHKPTRLQKENVQKLVEACDFIGFSNYHELELPPDVGDFSQGVEDFLKDMGVHGVLIPADTPLHFSEIGIGGCAENDRPTNSPAVAAKTPWKGSDNPRRNPWKEPAMRKLRLEYHRALLAFLAQQPATHRVAEAFIWSEGSWDPMGLASPDFADAEIITMIQQHNDAVADHASP